MNTSADAANSSDVGNGDDEVLLGGVANAGAVLRRGDEVFRPANTHSASIHAFLAHLRRNGFDGASEPLGLEDGRERLVFIAGDVALAPYPGWVQTDHALASIARLMRRMHDAALAFDVTKRTWNHELSDSRADGGDQVGGSIVCHNDICLENVVFRSGEAVALIDFDFAAPGRPVFDLAQFARMCIPLDRDDSAARLGWSPNDKPSRLRVVADAYGLDANERATLLGCIDVSMARGGEFVRRRVEAGEQAFIDMWNHMGGAERFERRTAWWQDRRRDFVAALR